MAPRVRRSCQRSPRCRPLSCQTTSGDCLLPRRLLAQRAHHPRADRVVGLLVDEDERAGGAVVVVGVGGERDARLQGDAGDVVECEGRRRRTVLERGDVEQRVERCHDRAQGARRVLERELVAALERPLRHPAHRRLQHAAGGRRRVDAAQQIAAPDVEIVLELDRDRVGRHGGAQRAVERLHGRDRGARAARQRHDLLPGAQRAARDLAGVAARAPAAVLGPQDPLDRQPHRPGPAVAGHVDLLEMLEQRRPVVPLGGAALDDVVAVQGRDREGARAVDADLPGQGLELPLDRPEAALVPVDQVHLVDRGHEVADAEQRRQRGVAARLLDDAVPGVDQDHRQVRGRGARDHVARVALVARRVGDDERAAGRGEVAVGDVDRDALLALGAQAVRDRGEVRRVAVAVRVQGVQLVLVQELGVVEQPADQGRLAVVDRSRGGQAQQLGAVGDRHLRNTPAACGPPSRRPTCGRPRGSRRAR